MAKNQDATYLYDCATYLYDRATYLYHWESTPLYFKQKTVEEVTGVQKSYTLLVNWHLKLQQATRLIQKLIESTANAFSNLATRNKVTIVWVPGHRGIVDNERTGTLAKDQGRVCSHLLGTELVCIISKALVCSFIKAIKAATQ